MKRKKNRYRTKLILKIFIFLFISTSYGQKGFYVDKDYRIKKYQSDMIKFLIDDKWLEKKEIGEIIISNYSGSLGVSKCIEIFPVEPQKTKVLLVRFYSLGSHALNYWGLLEDDNKFLFYYDEKNKTEIEVLLKKYDDRTKKIILNTLKIYDDWNKPSN
jgi:hypothetical protein